MPRTRDKIVGGHAVLAVGYQHRRKRFVVRNSWDASRGLDGYFTMPYAYLLAKTSATTCGRSSSCTEGHDSCTALAGRNRMWNKDEVRGKADQLKGDIKKGIGDLQGDEQLRDEGEADKAAGEVQETFGKGRRKVGEAVKDLGDKISH
jgi:uncharacterized protein YjbJ (UPF0337 family)